MRGLPGVLATVLALAASAAVVPTAAGQAPGVPALTVQSFGGNNTTTASIQVQLLLTWPDGADHVVVTNGDGQSQTYPVSDVVTWQLLAPTPQSAGDTRTVTVTYSGPSVTATVSDSILLDVQPPRLPVQRLFQNGKGWFLATSAEDGGAGVRSIALLGSSGQPITGTDLCTLVLCPPTADEPFFLKSARPRFARLTDAAGNTKAVQLVRRATTCSTADESYPVFSMEDRYYDCVRVGQSCRPTDGHFWNRSAYVRCRKVDGRFRVVARGA